MTEFANVEIGYQFSVHLRGCTTGQVADISYPDGSRGLEDIDKTASNARRKRCPNCLQCIHSLVRQIQKAQMCGVMRY